MTAITDLSTAGSAGDSDYLVVNQSGTDRKMTRTMLGLTGTGKVATGGFTLTLPATGTAALLGELNRFTAKIAFDSNSKSMMGLYSSATVSTSATTIITPGNRSSLVLVQGIDGSKMFTDLVLCMSYVGVATVISSIPFDTPATRTYAMTDNNLKLTMSTGTYTVQVVTIMTLADF
jgi:hypothetical protein